jgi:hypothetical protein
LEIGILDLGILGIMKMREFGDFEMFWSKMNFGKAGFSTIFEIRKLGFRNFGIFGISEAKELQDLGVMLMREFQNLGILKMLGFQDLGMSEMR